MKDFIELPKICLSGDEHCVFPELVNISHIVAVSDWSAEMDEGIEDVDDCTTVSQIVMDNNLKFLINMPYGQLKKLLTNQS